MNWDKSNQEFPHKTMGTCNRYKKKGSNGILTGLNGFLRWDAACKIIRYTNDQFLIQFRDGGFCYVPFNLIQFNGAAW